MKTFAERFNEALEIRNIKSTDIAKQLNIADGTISNYRKGKYVPKQNRIYELSKILNVNPAWLIGCDVPMDIKKEPTSVDSKRELLIGLIDRMSPEQQQMMIDLIKQILQSK